MAESTDSFAYWVRRRRKALDMSQAELAQQIPCSLAMIKKIEGDVRRPSPAMAERLAICLGLTTGERRAFLDAARGLRAVDTLALDGTPLPRPAPLDRLPVPVTPFIGRRSELAALSAMLTIPSVRLLTIVGPGGMGKTRLALAAAQAEQARQPRTFDDGIVFIDLAPVSSLEFVVLAIAAALGLDLAQRRSDTRSPIQQLLDFLRPRRMLLVLDNLEQLIKDGVASLILEILRGAPAVALLATSRQRLNLRDEHLYTLAGLPYATEAVTERSGDAEGDAAAQLLVVAVRRLRPDFVPAPDDEESIGRICRLVEGMPLALELAAAWVDTLSLRGIAAELQSSLDILASDLVDLPERHRSIRSTFDGTWRRLEPDEQAAFMRLSVFRGGMTRDAALQVAGASLPILVRLIGRCLVQFDPAQERYRLHEVLRQNGQEKLANAGELAVAQRRHFELYLSLAETAAARLFGPEQIAWLDRLEAEHDNARVALGWGLAQPTLAEEAARLVIAMAWFWRIRSHVLEGRTWLEQAVLRSGLTTATRANLLYHAGHLAWMQDDFALARGRAEESLRLWQGLGPAGQRGAGYASHTLGMSLYGTELRAPGDLDAAIRCFEVSHELFERVGDAWGVAFAQQWLAFAYIAQGKRAAALAEAEASLAGFRQLSNPWGAGMTLGALANLKLQAGELAEARHLAMEAQAMRQQVGHRHSLGVALELLARIALKENKTAEAAVFYQEAMLVFDGLGNQPSAEQMRAALATLSNTASAVSGRDTLPQEHPCNRRR